MNFSAPIVLTGATGFIGRKVVRWFEQNGRTPYTADLRRWRVEGGQLQLRGSDGIELPLIEQRGCTFIHLAWCAPVRESLQPHAAQVALLADLLQEYGQSFERVLAVGSAEEYGDRAGRLDESDAVHENLSPYGWGKRSAQMLVETWSRATNKPALWLRPFLVYGEGQEGNMAIPYAIRQAQQRQAATFSAGTQLRDFIHVDDVARGVGEAVLTPWKGFTIANLGTGIGTPLRTVLEQIARSFGVSDLFQFGIRPMRPGEPGVQIASTRVARDQFGFEAQIPLERGLLRLRETLPGHDVA